MQGGELTALHVVHIVVDIGDLSISPFHLMVGPFLQAQTKYSCHGSRKRAPINSEGYVEMRLLH
jgi:hypothetical protein